MLHGFGAVKSLDFTRARSQARSVAEAADEALPRTMITAINLP
jgi:hypothetical protein